MVACAAPEGSGEVEVSVKLNETASTWLPGLEWKENTYVPACFTVVVEVTARGALRVFVVGPIVQEGGNQLNPSNESLAYVHPKMQVRVPPLGTLTTKPGWSPGRTLVQAPWRRTIVTGAGMVVTGVDDVGEEELPPQQGKSKPITTGRSAFRRRSLVIEATPQDPGLHVTAPAPDSARIVCSMSAIRVGEDLAKSLDGLLRSTSACLLPTTFRFRTALRQASVDEAEWPGCAAHTGLVERAFSRRRTPGR
jgi:hypothetical protein